MLEAERRNPRAPGDMRMYLNYDKSHARWYVRVERKGRKIGLREVYGTAEFDAAYKAAVAELGGEVRMRRVDPDPKANDPRRYLLADRSRHGQLRHYVQIRDGISKIRIRAEHGSEEFDRLVTRAVESQIALYGDVTHTVGEIKRVRVTLPLPVTPPTPGTLRWYWTEYKQSGHWLGNESRGLKGLGSNSRHQRVLLMEPILYANGEKPFAVLTRKVIKAEMKARTPSQAGNLLSAMRGLIRWMIDEGHVDEDDPTIGLRTGKAAVSRESGGFKSGPRPTWTLYRARWAIGTEARLMFEILRCTTLPRLGDAARFGPRHVRKGRVRSPPRRAASRHQSRCLCITISRKGDQRHADRRGRVHRQGPQGRDRADEQEGLGGEVQEVRRARRRQRAEKELPWRAQGARRGRGLCRLHRGADDGDVRLDATRRCRRSTSPRPTGRSSGSAGWTRSMAL